MYFLEHKNSFRGPLLDIHSIELVSVIYKRSFEQ